MAHEIRAAAAPSKMLTARLYQGNTAVGSAIAMTESAQPGWYTGSVPSTTPVGLYQVLLLEAGTVLDAVPLQWDGVAAVEVIIPGPPGESGVCRVYGYVEGADNRKLPNITVECELLPASAAIASERLIAGRKVVLKTDPQGRLIGPTGDPWVDLQRTDLLDAEGDVETYYEVTSSALGVHRKRVTLTTTTADLRTLLITPAA